MPLLTQMNIVLYHKFTQNKDLKRELLSTGDAELIEVRAPCRVKISEFDLRIPVELGQRRVLGLWGRWKGEE